MSELLPEQSPPADARDDPEGGPERKVAVVVNGRARQVTSEVVEALDQILQSGDLYVSRSLAEAKTIAETIMSRGYPTVLTGGGDGTFVHMVSLIVAEAKARGLPAPRFGLLKLGTGNALSWVLGNHERRARGAVADLGRLRREGGSRTLRLLAIEGLLTPFAGLGVDAICLEHYDATKRWLAKSSLTRRLAGGPSSYAISIVTRSLPEFLARPHPHVRIVNDGLSAVRIGKNDKPEAEIGRGEVIYDGPSRLVAMSTIPYWGFGARVFPFAEERDDRFSLRVADVTSLEVASHFSALWKGTYRAPGIHDFLCDRITIHYDEPMPLQIGGDVVGRRTAVPVALGDPLEVVDYYAPPPLSDD